MSHVSTITVDTDGSITDTLVTGAFTTSGSNRHIDVIIGASTSSTMTPVSVSRGSETYTHRRSDGNPSGSSWAKGSFYSSSTEPQTGSAAMTVVNESFQHWGFSATVLDDVDQSTRFRDLGGGTLVALNPDGDGAITPLAITSAVGDLVVSGICVSGNTAPSAVVDTDVTQTLRGSWSSGAGNAVGLVATAPGATTATLGWNNTQFRFVHYAASHPPGATAPVITVPTGYIPTNNLGPRTISGISVTEGADPITLVTFTCTLGKGTMTMTASGSSAISGNGTNAISIIGGSETDINNTLATFAFTGLEPTRENVTVAILATDGTLNDTANLVLFNHRTSLTIVADSYADLVAMIQTAKMILPEDSTTGDVEIVAEDDAMLTDTQTITLFVPAGGGAGGFLLQFRRRRRQ